MQRLGELNLIQQLMPEQSNFKKITKFILMLLAIFFLIIAWANPQIGTRLAKDQRKGIDIVIAVDISRSMLAEDIQPNRLQYTKMIISKLVKELKDNKIGLVVFAGEAFIQLPVTSDVNSVDLFLNSVDVDLIKTQGTAIGAAIDKSVQTLELEKGKNKKAIILISDGENHEDDAVNAAKEASKKSIQVYTIGMGSPAGSLIPVGDNQYKKDKNGSAVLSKLNEKLLQDVASAGKGIYIRASSDFDALDAIFKEINKIEKTEYDAVSFATYQSLYPLFTLLSLICLLAEWLLSEKKSKWLSRINLFKNE